MNELAKPYAADPDDITANTDNRKSSNYETPDAYDTSSEKEAMESLAQLTDRLDKEDVPVTTENETLQESSNGTNGNVVYANLVVGRPVDSSRSDDLIHFDNSDTTSEGGKEQHDDTNDDKVDDEEPNPDYDVKAVRFHTEVLDADENKLQPLKVKGEDGGSGHDTSGEQQEDTDNTDKPNDDENTEAILDQSTEATNEDDDNTDGPSRHTGDGEKSEEEINSPDMKGQFYFAEEASTYF